VAKYTFSQGKIAVEEGIYLPLARRDRRLARAGVLLVIPPPSAAGQLTSTPDKEKTHDER
jgi:hypothetical protein